jgi:hypothetical protein
MRWKRTKLSVIVAGIFGASRQTNPRRAFVAPIVKWANRLSSNTGILSAYLGRESLTLKPLLSQSMKTSPFYRGYEIAVISIASTLNT